MTKKQRKIFYGLFFFIGLALMLWQILIYRTTIIPSGLLAGIVFSVGTLTFLLDYRYYKKTYDRYSWFRLLFYGFLQSTISYGFIACSFFVLTNYYFADEEVTQKAYSITKRSSLPGSKGSRSKRKPTFYINYKGIEKELVFPHEFYSDRHNYNLIVFEIRKGYFGFDILLNKELKRL